MPYRRGWVALLLFSLALINYIDRVTLSFAAEPIAREYGLSPVTLGYLFSSFLWTYTLCLLPVGMLVDRFGAKRVAGFGIGIWSLATVATGLVSSFGALLATRLVMGGGEASSNPAGARVIREWIPAGERGTLNAVFNSGSYAGPALCALVAGPIIALLGWRALFFAAGGIGLVWLLCWVFWFAPPVGSLAVRPGAGPRHVAFHPAAPLAFVAHELDSSVGAYHYDTGTGALAALQVIPSIPDTFTGANTAAEIDITADGRFVFVSNRGHDSVGTFAVDAASGRLSPVAWASSGGTGPRFTTLDASGATLYAANETSDTIVPLAVDGGTGRLSRRGEAIATGSPVCIVFRDGEAG